MVSAPPSPSRTLAAPLPVIVLTRLLPVPLIALAPVRVRFSMFEPRVKVTELCTSSVPPTALVSVTVSPTLSTI